MKLLYLVRHAKSSWKDASLSDIERPLNKRGLKNAPEMARRLKEAGTSIDRIISSPATRALSTAQYLASAIGYSRERIEQQQQMYFAGSSSMLEIIQNTKSSIQSLMLVGHNPDMTTLFNSLCGYQTHNMPTCAIASIEIEPQWSEVSSCNNMLIDYDFPKKAL